MHTAFLALQTFRGTEHPNNAAPRKALIMQTGPQHVLTSPRKSLLLNLTQL